VREGRATVFSIAALAVLALWAYSTSFHGVFVFDDIPAIAENPTIRSLSTTAVLHPPERATVSGRPLTNLSFALNYALAPPDVQAAMHPDAGEAFYRNVWGYHAVNVGIHLLAALALFGIVRRTLTTAAFRGRFDGVESWLALLSAAIWLVHPLHTQAVTYIVQRAESAMGLCYLLTLYCAIRASASRSRRTAWTAAAVALCAMGMMIKEVIITAPLLVWLWDRVFLTEPDHPGPGVHRWTLYAGLAATLAIPISIALTSETQGSLVLQFMLAPERGAADAVQQAWTSWTYLLTQSGVVLYYLRQALVPTSLVFDHYDWPQMRSLTAVLPSMTLLVPASAAVVVGLIRRSPVAFAGAWFFVTLAPTSSVVPIPTEVAAEHRMYLPLAGLVTLTVAGIYLLGDRVSQRVLREWPANVWPHAPVVVICAAIIVTFGTLTHERNKDYWSDERLWHDTVEKRPSNARARINYGINLMATGRYADAAAQMRAAVLLPADPATAAQAHVQLGSALSAQGQFELGESSLQKALELDPGAWEAHMILGQAYSEGRDVRRAVDHFLKALDHHPDEVVVLNRTAWLLATAAEDDVRNGTLAVQLGERALRLTNGQNEATLVSLAAAYGEVSRFQEAAATVKLALAGAEARGDRAAASTLSQHLALYAAGRKLRASPE
jgi:tetratricopeptide (TPR) repeat protein